MRTQDDMIQRFSGYIVNYLIRSEVIEDSADDKEYYQYGVEITVSTIISLLLAFLIGVLTSSILEVCIFLLSLIPIRQFTGGYHANTYFKCNLWMCILCSLTIFIYHITKEVINIYGLIFITIIPIIIIAIFSPIENPNKQIPYEKRPRLKCISIIFALFYGLVGNIMIALTYKIGMIVLYTLFLVAVLMIVALLKERRCKHEKGCSCN